MDQIPSEIIFNEILIHLPCTDLINFKRCNKLISSLIPNSALPSIWRKRLEYYLETLFGDDLNILYDFLEESGAGISGSTILQAILGEYYESDLDIVCPTGNNYEDKIVKFCEKLNAPLESISNTMYTDVGNAEKLLIKKIYESMYLGNPEKRILRSKETPENIADIEIIFDSDIEDIDGESTVDDYNIDYSPKSLTTFVASKRKGPAHINSTTKKLQFICTDLEIDCQVATYDFKVVQNLYIRSKTGSKLTISDSNSIINKLLIMTNSSDEFTKNSITRIERYINRGYKVRMPSEKQDFELLDTLLYNQMRERGNVNITLTFNLNNDRDKHFCEIYHCNKKFRCLLHHFHRNYEHMHVIPRGVENMPDPKGHYKYCSEIIIELL